MRVRVFAPRALALVPVFVASMAGQANAQAQELTFRQTNIPLAEGPSPPPVTVVVQALKVPLQTAGQQRPTLALSDVEAGTPPGLLVQFSRIEELFAPDDSTRYWKALLTVNGIAPQTDLKRTISMALGKQGYLATLTLNNQVTGEFTWSVSQPQDFMLRESRRTSVSVTTGARPATNVRLVQSSLKDAATKIPLGTEHLQLDGGDRIPEKSTKELALFVKPGFTSPGTFTGSLALAVDQQAAVQSVNLTVYSSSGWYRFLGVLAIAFGVALYLLIGVVAKNKANQLEVRRAVAVLSERLPALRKTVDEATKKSDVEQLRKRLSEAETGLSVDYLKRSGLWPGLWSAFDKQATELAKHLGEMAKLVRMLDEIVGRGVDTVLRKWQETDPFRKALRDLNDLAVPGTEPSTLPAAVTAILKKLEEKTAGPLWIPPDRTFQQIFVEIERLWAALWFGWATVTTVAGFAALILTNPGFGTGLDRATCFFWGLGVQMAGQQLQQLSPSKIATRFSLPVPKEA